MLLPTTFPIAMSRSPRRVATIEVAISGAEVPAAITVNPITSSVLCRLTNVGGAGASTRSTRDQPVRADGTSDNFTLTALFQVTSGQKLELQCYKDNPASGARISRANIIAVQISDVTGSTE